MTTDECKYGEIQIHLKEQLFTKAVDIIRQAAKGRDYVTVGLSGGNTPQAWYHWIVQNKAIEAELIQRILWFVSDERYVPLSSEESNFGVADRLLLTPMDVPQMNRFPWNTSADPHSTAILYNHEWDDRFGHMRCFDVCFLGLGEDCHTASIFPGSPLLEIDVPDNFSLVEVPGKGFRMSITPAGLKRCRHIVVLATGKSKAHPLSEVMTRDYEPLSRPAQWLGNVKDKVIWLADDEAGALL